MSRVLIFFFAVLLCSASYAQTDNGVRVWTLKECVDYALSNNLDVQRSQYGVESSEISQDVARMAMLPSLNANISNGYNWGRSINPVTNQFTTQQITSLGPNASSSVTLFNGLRLQSSLRQSNRDLAASEQDLLKAKNDVSLNVINLYINVIFNKELLENARLQLSSSRQQLERTKKQVAAGALPKADELNLSAQVATNELAVINNENALTLSLLQLKQALQLPGSEPMDVEVPDLSIEDLVIDQSSQEIFEIARQTMPEIKSANFQLSSASYGVKAAKGSLFPRLSLNASVNSNYSSANDRPIFIPGDELTRSNNPIPAQFYSVDGSGNETLLPVVAYQLEPTGTYTDGYGYSDQFSDNFFRQVSVSLSIPLFNGMQARAGVRRAVVNQHLAEINAKQVNQTLRQNVETAFNDAVAASKSYSSSLRQVEAREEAYRMTKERFDLGAANFVEYQVAENELFRAKSDLARAKYNFIFRKKLLDFYQGKPLGF